MDERIRPFLLPTGNPREKALDAMATEEPVLRNIFSLFVESTRLWFRVEYTLGGVRLGIEPEEFMATRVGSAEDRHRFLRDRPLELLEATNIIVTIINPKMYERPKA